MKYRLIWLFLLVASTACLGLDRNAFTFTNYNLHVRIEPGQQRLAVRGRVTLRNDSRVSQKNAALQISSSLDWRSIQIDGKPVQFVSQPYASDIDHTGALSEAIVTLPATLAPKATIDIEVGYEGVIPLDITRLQRIGVPEDVAKHSDWDLIGASFTAVRGIGYVAWYPVAMDAANLSEGNSAFNLVSGWKAREQNANMDVDFCVVSAGQLPTTLLNDDSGKISTGGAAGAGEHFESCSQHKFAPLGVTVPAFVSAEYESTDVPGLKILFLPRSETDGKKYAEIANTVLPFIKDWFGATKQTLNVAQLEDGAATPFETGGLMFTTFNYDPKLAELSLAHELTHSAIVSPRPWIYEGLAHFAQALWREHTDGRQAAVDFISLHRTALAGLEEHVSPDSPPLTASADEEMYRSKAMFVWWMLRDMIGEKSLKRVLAAYNPAEDRDPGHMQKLVQSQTTRDLQWFFDDWVYHDRGLPDFAVKSEYASKTNRGGYLVTVTIENTGTAGAEIPFTVAFEGGEVTNRIQVQAKSEATTRVETTAAPTEVVVNDGSVPESNLTNNIYKVNQASR